MSGVSDLVGGAIYRVGTPAFSDYLVLGGHGPTFGIVRNIPISLGK